MRLSCFGNLKRMASLLQMAALANCLHPLGFSLDYSARRYLPVMNIFSLLSRPVLLCTLAALFGGCSQAKQEDPTPKEYAVRVHVTGVSMWSGSAIINSTHDYAGVKGAPVENAVITHVYSTKVNDTYDLGKFGAADRIRVRIEMSAGASESMLTADILVNGLVKKSCFVKGGSVFTSCELATDSL